MAISVGFGMALAIGDPLLINLITNALMFVVLLFSPIVILPGHFPGWLLTADRAAFVRFIRLIPDPWYPAGLVDGPLYLLLLV